LCGGEKQRDTGNHAGPYPRRATAEQRVGRRRTPSLRIHDGRDTASDERRKRGLYGSRGHRCYWCPLSRGRGSRAASASVEITRKG
jgi:hypothetical protein